MHARLGDFAPQRTGGNDACHHAAVTQPLNGVCYHRAPPLRLAIDVAVHCVRGMPVFECGHGGRAHPHWAGLAGETTGVGDALRAMPRQGG